MGDLELGDNGKEGVSPAPHPSLQLIDPATLPSSGITIPKARVGRVGQLVDHFDRLSHDHDDEEDDNGSAVSVSTGGGSVRRFSSNEDLAK